MLWEDILRTLGGMAILVAAIAWLSKALLTALLSKDLEHFKSELEISSQKSIEAFKASLQLEAQRNAIEFAALHAKRAELVAELYSRIVSLYAGILKLAQELGAREVRSEDYMKYEAVRAQPWEIKPGIHTLSESEEAKATALQEAYKDLCHFYNEKKIYFSIQVCEQIDSFAALAGYIAVMYQNVAIRDDDNQPYVNPLVVKVWNQAGEKATPLLSAVESEFRTLLGVSNAQA
ncbi:hypothetical protein [Pararobbsia alpina]|uniref:Uncharacterized protein n=1 Tax=Pararobbsia alpina TaxID=621374 RepID=A0A6S7BME4_9BURK|nr:hypothetical protein [Pararobbsia alpina]CAB3805636.1 hypothetical protein LMG28138_05700 [Pararobbsia alpina]